MKSMKALSPALVSLAVSTAFAQQGTVIRTETRVVLVDTIVTDKEGAWVHGLAAKDFRLLKQQTTISEHPA